VARATGHRDLDLHAAPLPAIDTECTFLTVAGSLGEDHHVGDHARRRAGEHLVHDVLRAATVVVFLGDGRVRAHDHAAQCTFVGELEQNPCGDDLRDHAGELIGGTTAEHQVHPFVVGWQVSELGPERVMIEPRRVAEPLVGVDGATEFRVPLVAQCLHGVGVPVEVDDLLVVGVDAVVRIGDLPDEIAEFVEVDVVRMPYCAEFDDAFAEEFESRAFVVGQATVRIAALVTRHVDVVVGDPDGLLQDLHSFGPAAPCQFRDSLVERHVTRSLRLSASQLATRGRRPWPPRALP